ncbi:MAG: CBS domain-containing protein [Candidatus Roizmanbacteria bacterium]|nr:CBS domain-containing protein [Candidatus Roizmanbacteria bacterium]
MDVITTHINADFDALASMLAAKKFYPDAVMIFPGSQEKGVRDFLSASHIVPDFKRIRDINLDDITRVIFVDVRNPGRIGRFSEILGKKGLMIHIYDHHPSLPEDIKAQKEIIEHVGATSTIFIEMLKEKKIEITPVEATVLALGVYEETGSLVFPSTTGRDLTAAAYLVQRGANLNIVASYISRELSPEEIDLLNELIHSSRDLVIHGLSIKIAKASREKYIGDIAYLAHKLRDMDDIDALFLLVMMEDRVHIIARSRAGEVDVSEILQPFGGGGHPSASSATVRSESLEDVEEGLLIVLNEKIKPAKTAKDIMTSPVKTIQWDSTIKTAEQTLTKYGINVLPVLKGSNYAGLISREVIEMALFHGFKESNVYEFCTTDALTVKPETSIREVESLMIEQNQRFMPVVINNKEITGAITRTDLLRSLYEDILRKSRLEGEELREKPSMGKNILSLVKEKFPEEIFNVLRLSGEIAEGLGFPAYLVGGSVRDLIRGETNLDIDIDIDIVIEGDAIAFARAIGEKLNAKVKTHQRFGTAVVVAGSLKFDVATARTEYYESPGALPKVEMSSIKKDLYRRDFTINALAVKLNSGDFGMLLDFFGAQRDLKEKTIRILHNLSFIEDPTRAFRAIRFSERFGFKISKHTLNLIKTAVKINLFEKLSGSRLYDEVNLLFLETVPLKAVKRLSELDLLKVIHPAIALTAPIEKTFENLEESAAWFKLLFTEEPINKSHLFLMALLERLKPEEIEKALQRLFVPPTAKKEIIEGIKQSKAALMKLQNASQKDIYYALQPLSIRAILFAMAKATDKSQKKAISLYLTTLRKIKPALTGNDLEKMGYKPGPLFNKILRAILDARLEGQIKSREDEARFVKEQFPL